ncbi:MAG: phage tail fiber protein [Shewanella sp.]
MSLSNAAETALLNQLFVGTALPWNANTNLWLALYTADPGEAGTAITSEATYGGYARVVLTRASDFTVSGNQVSNANLEQFAACSSGSNVITHAAIVDSVSGAGNIIVRAALNASITVSTGVQPQFAANALSFTAD